MEEGFEIGVQILPAESKMIKVHRDVVAKLREDSVLRGNHEALKRSLAGLSREDYKKQKHDWIGKNILPYIDST